MNYFEQAAFMQRQNQLRHAAVVFVVRSLVLIVIIVDRVVIAARHDGTRQCVDAQSSRIRGKQRC